MISRYGNFISGRWSPPVNQRYLLGRERNQGASLCQVARSDHADILLALSAAEAGADHWYGSGHQARDEQLRRLADFLHSKRLSLAAGLAWQRGESIQETLQNSVFPCIYQLRTCTAPARSDAVQIAAGAKVVKQVIPAGIDPAFLVWRLSSVLAMGCCVVLALVYKADTEICLQHQTLLELIGQELPAGVFNLVTGLSLEVGTALAECFVDDLLLQACPA